MNLEGTIFKKPYCWKNWRKRVPNKKIKYGYKGIGQIFGLIAQKSNQEKL